MKNAKKKKQKKKEKMEIIPTVARRKVTYTKVKRRAKAPNKALNSSYMADRSLRVKYSLSLSPSRCGDKFSLSRSVVKATHDIVHSYITMRLINLTIGMQLANVTKYPDISVYGQNATDARHKKKDRW